MILLDVKQWLIATIVSRVANVISDTQNGFRALFEEHHLQMDIKVNEITRQLKLVTCKLSTQNREVYYI